ncbi:MAG: sulfite exporter TauE/SafE family protein [Rhodobacteraceae bacterium]|nr:sulfite exporter TauE/SafE family protein [Paracoccaceae bacterium]
MTLDLIFFLFAVPAVIFAGISKGGFGSNASFAATPLLALILEPAQAIGLLMPLLLLMDFSALKPYWRKWDWPASVALMVGGVPGVLAGVALFKVADPDVFRLLIGVIAIGFVLFQVGRGRGLIPMARRPLSERWGLLFGALSGFTSFVSHAGGPLAAVYLLSKPISKTAYQATTVITFTVVNVMKLTAYLAIGVFDSSMVMANIYLAPAAVLGVWLGVVMHRAMPERWFFGVTYVLLLITGSKLIWDALS